MKPSAKFESIASVIALVVVLVFGFDIFPILNPIQYGFIFGEQLIPVSLLCLPVSLFIMWKALRLTREAQRLKHAEEAGAVSEENAARTDRST